MTVIRRRKKPVEVNTVQWTGDNEAEVQAFTGGASEFYALDDADRENSDDPEATATVYDKLHSTWVLVYTGQHIVRGVKGEFYPIAEDVLAETYELAAAPSAPADRAGLRERIAEAMREHYLCTDRAKTDADGNSPCRCGDWREPGPMGADGDDWDSHIADVMLAALPEAADRAAALREAADAVDSGKQSFPETVRSGASWAARMLRRLAAEAQQQPDTETLAAVFEGFGRLLATSSRDWGQYAPDAWLYAVILGWDCEQTEHDETCTHGAMEEMQERHGWDAETVAKARRYRAAVRALTEAAAGARQDGAQT